jgi:Protein of unknown function (DUF2281)
MSTHPQDVQALIDKIQSLPTERIAEVEDFVDFLKSRTEQRNQAAQGKKPLDFPVESVGEWPTDLSLRREDMYGDDGR